MSRSSGGHKINDNPESDEQEQQHYDEKSTIEKCKKPSNDELLYDPDLDEKDEIWMQRKFSSN
ncbi:12003_t:CDS:2 [Ambispora gerdemannii]|uniref:12003_t:CDS:1 n=1 Tax=Ambispora gerdemannii TaxID=144530 RepID=A0A9N8YZB3_9GLOM|nr:12003_t:CDS:2 [Ambispora gerdemannii]